MPGWKGYPELSGRDALVSEATNELIYAIRAVLYALYSHSRSSIRWTKPTQQLDQEEALAYVLAEILCYNILPTESRSIGEIARHAAVAFKGKPPDAKGKRSRREYGVN